jgi:hypothetical protein
MFLTRLANLLSGIFLFWLVFTLSAVVITTQTLFFYLGRMFDLPMEVILAIRGSDEDTDERFQE